MPSHSSITTAEKSLIKKNAANSTDKILSAAVGRVYYAHPDPNHWTWAGGLEGAIVFGNTSKGNGSFWFKAVDITGSRGVIWQHELYDDLSYNQDRTFFHSFAGDECMIGFVFSDEGEASSFYKKVSNRAKHAPKKTESGQKASGGRSSLSLLPSFSSKKKKAKVDKTKIGDPSSFQRVSHMGFDTQKGFTMENIDPSWGKLLEQLGHMGISQSQIKGNEEFIKDFVDQHGGVDAMANQQQKTQSGPPQPAPPPPAPPAVPSAIDSAPSETKKAPAPKKGHRKPPPAPPSKTSLQQSEEPTSPPSPAAPSPPPPPARPIPGAPPPPPSRPAEAPAAPPPPVRDNTLPVPPAPPARSSAPPAPPPPPPPPAREPTAPPAPPARVAAPPAPPPPPPPPPREGAPTAPPAPPARAGAPPPPPPPPPARSDPAPPPPPPARPGEAAAETPSSPSASPASVPPSTDARANLLASIQGQSVHNLRKTDNDGPSPAKVGAGAAAAGVGVGAGAAVAAESDAPPDLASTLAAALNDRQGRMGGDSSDSNSEDDDW